ncbi:unnamed protein product, partial [Polarella glacialis]
MGGPWTPRDGGKGGKGGKGAKGKGKAFGKGKDLTGVSKRLTWLLRHGAAEAGLPMDSEGWVAVEDTLRFDDLRGSSLEQIQEIVRTCPKKRFDLKERSPSAWFIRATQGHSITEVGDTGHTAIRSAEELGHKE